MFPPLTTKILDKVVLNWLILEKDKSRTLWYQNTNSGSRILVPFPVAGKFWEALHYEKSAVYLALDGNTVVSDVIPYAPWNRVAIWSYLIILVNSFLV